MGKRKKKKRRVPRSPVKGAFVVYGDCPDCEKHFKVKNFDDFLKSGVCSCPSCGASVYHLYSDFEVFGKS